MLQVKNIYFTQNYLILSACNYRIHRQRIFLLLITVAFIQVRHVVYEESNNKKRYPV